MVNNLDWCCGF